MTEKEVWDFLKEGKGKKKLLRELIVQLQQLEADENCIKAIDYEKPSVSGGTTSDLSDAVIRSEAARERVKRSIVEMQAEIDAWKEQAISMIRVCRNDMQRGILTAKFLNGKSWRKIQEEYHYSESQPYAICRIAITEIARNYRR